MEPFGPACDLDGRGMTHMHLPGLLCGGLGGGPVPFYPGALHLLTALVDLSSETYRMIVSYGTHDHGTSHGTQIDHGRQ